MMVHKKQDNVNKSRELCKKYGINFERIPLMPYEELKSRIDFFVTNSELRKILPGTFHLSRGGEPNFSLLMSNFNFDVFKNEIYRITNEKRNQDVSSRVRR